MKKMSYFKKKGDSYIIFTATGLILSLAMVVLIMAIILMKGLGFFWPSDLTLAKMKDGQQFVIREPMVDEQILSGYLDESEYKKINFSEIEAMGIKKLNKGGTIGGNYTNFH